MMVLKSFMPKKRVRVKGELQDAIRTGWCYGYIEDNSMDKWGIVLWDGQECPVLLKTEGLLEQAITWRECT